jgi:hypothetical protein
MTMTRWPTRTSYAVLWNPDSAHAVHAHCRRLLVGTKWLSRHPIHEVTLMPMLRLSDATIRPARKAGCRLVRIGAMAPDMTRSVPVDTSLALLIEERRVRGEHDDAVFSRTVVDLAQSGAENRLRLRPA